MGVHDINSFWKDYSDYLSPDLKDLIKNPRLSNRRDIVEVRTGSDSDFPKILSYLNLLREVHIPYWLTILSAHRTPNDMAESARTLPNILLHHELRRVVDITWLRVKFATWAAWGSAHIAGMSASETQTPFIALPVISSACGLDDSSLSMIQMPPHKPNGFVPNNEVGGRVAWKLFDMDLENGYNQVSLNLNWTQLSENDEELIKKLWLEININGGSPICISIDDLNIENTNITNEKFNIFIPLKEWKGIATFEMLELIRNYQKDGVYMGMQNIEWSTSFTNAIIYAAQVLGMFTPEIRRKAEIHSADLAYEVSQKRLAIEMQQTWISPEDMINLPPKYKHLYAGKVRELYEHPENPDWYIIVATDRISTHDVVHRNTVPWKGKVLTQVSNYWFKKIKGNESTKHIPTQIVEWAEFPEDFPEHLKERSIIVKKTIPIPVESIKRGHLYGSAWRWYNPETGKLATGEFVWKWLKKCDKFKKPLFTPSTKSNKGDKNINYKQMLSVLEAWLISIDRTDIDVKVLANKLQSYSDALYDFAYEEAEKKWYILWDTKFEFWLDENGEPVLIDEMCTPDSSRFWKLLWFEVGEEPESSDKEPARIEAVKYWKENPDENGKFYWEEWFKPYPIRFSDWAVWDCISRYEVMESAFSE